MTGRPLIGQLLLWAGFLGAAYATVCRLDRPEAIWDSIPWGGYGVSVAVGMAGVLVLRRERQMRRLLSADSSADLESVIAHLSSLRDLVDELGSRIDAMTCEQVLEYVDDRCVPRFADFADARMVIANRFGTAVYAEVMTEFAAGERYLNRGWSAAADGYVDEVERCVQASRQFIDAAAERLLAARDAHASS